MTAHSIAERDFCFACLGRFFMAKTISEMSLKPLDAGTLRIEYGGQRIGLGYLLKSMFSLMVLLQTGH